MKVEFNVKYGKNTIEIPIPESPRIFGNGLTDLFTQEVTIYNDIPARGEMKRSFKRFVIPRCNIQGLTSEKPIETVREVSEKKKVYTKAVDKFKNRNDYIDLCICNSKINEEYFTVSTGDFIVFGNVKDEVLTASDFAELQKKYRHNGMKIESFAINIFGMENDNISFE